MRNANTRMDVIHTLLEYSSIGYQLKYKRSVPFVNVTAELAAQWTSVMHLLGIGDNACDNFNKEELAGLYEFDKCFLHAEDKYQDWPDVEAFSGTRDWKELQAAALKALSTFPVTEVDENRKLFGKGGVKP